MKNVSVCLSVFFYLSDIKADCLISKWMTKFRTETVYIMRFELYTKKQISQLLKFTRFNFVSNFHEAEWGNLHGGGIGGTYSVCNIGIYMGNIYANLFYASVSHLINAFTLCKNKQCHSTYLINKHYQNYLMKCCVIKCNFGRYLFRLVKAGFHYEFQIHHIIELHEQCHHSTAKLLQDDKRKAICRGYITVRRSVELIYSTVNV